MTDLAHDSAPHTEYLVTYGSAAVAIRSSQSPALALVLDEILAFLRPHVSIVSASDQRDDITLDLVVTLEDWRDREIDTSAFEPTVIRKSSAEAFNFHGLERRRDNEHVIVCESTRTKFAIRPADRRATISMSPASTIQVVDFLRDLIIKLEEHAGGVVFHAAAVELDGRAIAIVGRKGAGKTTLLYELIATGRVVRVSGDKLVARVDRSGRVRVTGWPDYPHVGVGTIRAHPTLAAALEARGVNLDVPPTDKILFEPDLLDQVFGPLPDVGALPLGAIVLPEIASGDTSSSPVELMPSDEPPIAEVMRCLEPSRSNPFSGWHELVATPTRADTAQAEDRLARSLAGVSFLRTRGAGVGDAVLDLLEER